MDYGEINEFAHFQFFYHSPIAIFTDYGKANKKCLKIKKNKKTNFNHLNDNTKHIFYLNMFFNL